MNSPVIYNTAFQSLRDTDTIGDATPRMLGGKRAGG